MINDGSCEGVVNMATDQALLRACDEGQAPPTLRLYGWAAPTLTVGYSQRIQEDLNLDRCNELGISVVRRPTGGRALLHHRELTYSLVAPIPHPRFESHLHGAFCAVSRALLNSLEKWGVRGAVMVDGQRKSIPRGRPAVPSCLATFNHGEIMIDRKKLVGSAQRRTNRAFLQHGSVLIGLDRELLNSLFCFSGEGESKKSLQTLQQNTTTLEEYFSAPVSMKEGEKAFRQGFSESLGVRWETRGLSAYEQELRENFLLACVTAPK